MDGRKARAPTPSRDTGVSAHLGLVAALNRPQRDLGSAERALSFSSSPQRALSAVPGPEGVRMGAESYNRGSSRPVGLLGLDSWGGAMAEPQPIPCYLDPCLQLVQVHDPR